METFNDFLTRKTFDFDGKNKFNLDDHINENLTLIDYTKIPSTKYGACTYACIVSEYPNAYFFSPAVLTEMIDKIETNRQMKENFINHGLVFCAEKITNKAGNNEYFNFKILN